MMPNLANQRVNLASLVEMIDIEINSTNNFSFCDTAPERGFVKFTHGVTSEVPSGLRIYAELPFDFTQFKETEAGPQPIVDLNIGKLDGLFVNFLDQLELDGETLIGKKLIRTLTRAPFIDNLVGTGATGQFITQTVFRIDEYNSSDTRNIKLKLTTPLDLRRSIGQTLLWDRSTGTTAAEPGVIFLHGIRP